MIYTNSFNFYNMSLTSYNKLINTCVNEGNVKKVYQLFQEMQRKGVQPDTTTYNSIIELSVNMNQKEAAGVYFVEMKARGLQPNLTTYNLLSVFFTKNDAADPIFSG